MTAEAQGATTVTLRVQVIDLRSFTLDLQVPTYLPARDLTQRVARDAGLEAYWPDGRRRLYWLRARGRLLRDDEKLSDLGVVDGELVYLLPEPPHGSGVVEQPPEYPETHPYAGAGYAVSLGALAAVGLWSIGWGVALTHDRSPAVVMLPGLALGFLCVSLARHAWGGDPRRVRVVATGLVLQVMLTALAFLPPIVLNGWITDSGALLTVALQAAPGFMLGVFGAFAGWLAWWGAVEPLPPVQVQRQEEASQAIAVVPCGVCGAGVEPGVRTDCPHGCGAYFHQGCWRAKQAVYRGDRGKCAVCARRVA